MGLNIFVDYYLTNIVHMNIIVHKFLNIFGYLLCKKFKNLMNKNLNVFVDLIV